MRGAVRKIDPEEYILSVLTPQERFEAAMRMAREVFRDTTLTMEDIEATIDKVRRKHYAAQRKKAARRR